MLLLTANPSVDATVLSSWKLSAPKGGGGLRFVSHCKATSPPTAKEHTGEFYHVPGATIWPSQSSASSQLSRRGLDRWSWVLDGDQQAAEGFL